MKCVRDTGDEWNEVRRSDRGQVLRSMVIIPTRAGEVYKALTATSRPLHMIIIEPVRYRCDDLTLQVRSFPPNGNNGCNSCEVGICSCPFRRQRAPRPGCGASRVPVVLMVNLSLRLHHPHEHERPREQKLDDLDAMMRAPRRGITRGMRRSLKSAVQWSTAASHLMSYPGH